jgi:hypothetical protein
LGVYLSDGDGNSNSGGREFQGRTNLDEDGQNNSTDRFMVPTIRCLATLSLETIRKPMPSFGLVF